MTRILLTPLSLTDLFVRLHVTESPVCFFERTTPQGWESFLGFSPVAAYSGGLDTPPSAWQDFIEEEHGRGREVVGYLSFDLAARRHGVVSSAPDYFLLPDVVFYSFDHFATEGQNGSIIHVSDPRHEDIWQSIIHRPPILSPASHPLRLEPMIAKSRYLEDYERVRAYLYDGHVYQVNLTHCLRGTTEDSSRALALRLLHTTKVDFFAYIEGEKAAVISASPERFVRIDQGMIETTPMKGTRPRGGGEHDRMLYEELVQSEKERAELAMITDLLRNDLGAVCAPGTVAVIDHRVITALPNVWQAHARIRGQLAHTYPPLQALWSMLPGGSISGCPKRRALQVITELEHYRRGIYTGIIGRFTPTGTIDTSIAIRTLITREARVFLPVGGGIVWDSDGEAEWQETWHKAAGLLL